MRVLIIHTRYQQGGGEDTVVAAEAQQLVDAGIDVQILYFNNAEKALLKLLQLPFNISAYRQTIQKIKAFRPDLIHIHNLHFGASPSVLYAAEKMNVPVVSTLHNYRLICPSATLFYNGKIQVGAIGKKFPWSAVKSGLYKNSRLLTGWLAFGMWLHRHAGSWTLPKRFIVLGKHSAELFAQSHYRQLVPRMRVKPNCCPANNAVMPRDDFYLYVGRLSEEKGIDIMLKAFAETGLILKVAGDGPLQDLVAGYAKRYAHIQYLGRVNREQANNLFVTAQALVFPSMWYEPFGMVIIESFAAGTPVIASAIGNLKELIAHQQNGLLFNTGDVESLIAQLLYFHHLPESQKNIYRKNARVSHQKHFSPGQNTKQLLAIYDEVLSSSKWA